MKFRNPASRFALVGVFVSKKGTEHTRRRHRRRQPGRIPAGRRPRRHWPSASNPKSLEGLKISADGLNADIHAGADYRAHLIGVMTQRAVTKALGK